MRVPGKRGSRNGASDFDPVSAGEGLEVHEEVGCGTLMGARAGICEDQKSPL